MTTDLTLRFDILGYWHCSSGEGRAAHADRLVVRDQNGLPYIPGRTIKGRMRAALRMLVDTGHVEEARVSLLLGSEPAQFRESDEEGETLSRYLSEPGILRFGNGRLPEAYQAYFRNPEVPASLRAAMFTLLPQTALTDEGTVLAKSLRVTEVALPMTLRASVTCNGNDSDWQEDLRRAVPFVRSFGLGRHRGLGRVQVSVED